MTIRAHFQLRRDDFTLDVEFETPSRGVSAVFGPSGSGKTTLLRSIAGLERCQGGHLVVEGHVWQDETVFLAPHQRPVGYVFQESSLFAHLDVRRNLEYGYRRVPGGERRVEFDEAVALLGVEPLLTRSPEGLSGGERQRVAIARALLVSPRLLLMDEPMASLDAASKSEIVPYLSALHADLEIPVIYVSHSADEVARFADHLILLEQGRVISSGPIAEILTRTDLPPALGADAESVIEAVVAAHDDEFDLTELEFAGGGLTVAGTDLPIGRAVRIRILARDVSLTLEHQTATSILNIVPATVLELAEQGRSRVVVRLEAGGTPLLAHITRRSAAALDLSAGHRLFAQIKSVALLA